MTVPAVRFDGISKRFPGARALDRVSFEIAAGSCHALCGENGAGPSARSSARISNGCACAHRVWMS
jgi:ABC-type sugar transport system ATPase subunit